MVLRCIDSCNNRVESPQTICYNLVKLTGVVGPDRVMAGSDCGFSTTAESGSLTEATVWLNLKSLVRGVECFSIDEFMVLMQSSTIAKIKGRPDRVLLYFLFEQKWRSRMLLRLET